MVIGWECLEATVCLVGKLLRINRPINKVPKSISISRSWKLANKTLSQRSPKWTWNKTMSSTCKDCLVAGRSFGNNACLFRFRYGGRNSVLLTSLSPAPVSKIRCDAHIRRQYSEVDSAVVCWLCACSDFGCTYWERKFIVLVFCQWQDLEKLKVYCWPVSKGNEKLVMNSLKSVKKRLFADGFL